MRKKNQIMSVLVCLYLYKTFSTLKLRPSFHEQHFVLLGTAYAAVLYVQNGFSNSIRSQIILLIHAIIFSFTLSI